MRKIKNLSAAKTSLFSWQNNINYTVSNEEACMIVLKQMQHAFRIPISDIFAWLFQSKIQYHLSLRRIVLKNLVQ